MAKKTLLMDSVLDLNSTNIWTVDEYQLSSLWEQTKQEEDFATSEDKLLNVIRQAFEVVHYNPDDVRDVKKYENGEWALMTHCRPGKGSIALRRKVIKNLSDLTYENVKHITVATLLELIDRNFGGGWDSISTSTKDIINSAFEISTTQLPASRIHAPGGTLELKVSLGFEVLEIAKGTWVEAIFAKKKEPITKIRATEDKYDEEGNLRKSTNKFFDEDDEDLPEDPEQTDDDDDLDNSPDEDQMDEMYYSNFSEGVKSRDDQDDDEYAGLSIDEGEE